MSGKYLEELLNLFAGSQNCLSVTSFYLFAFQQKMQAHSTDFNSNVLYSEHLIPKTAQQLHFANNPYNVMVISVEDSWTWMSGQLTTFLDTFLNSTTGYLPNFGCIPFYPGMDSKRGDLFVYSISEYSSHSFSPETFGGAFVVTIGRRNARFRSS